MHTPHREKPSPAARIAPRPMASPSENVCAVSQFLRFPLALIAAAP